MGYLTGAVGDVLSYREDRDSEGDSPLYTYQWGLGGDISRTTGVLVGAGLPQATIDLCYRSTLFGAGLLLTGATFLQVSGF